MTDVLHFDWGMELPEVAAAPANPAAGVRRIYALSTGCWSKDSAGTVTQLGGGGSKTIRMSVASRVFTNLGAGPSEPNTADRTIVDLSSAPNTNARLLARVTTAGVTGDLKAQYSTDGTTFSDISSLIDMSTTGLKASASLALPAAAKALVTLRMVGVGGNGTEDPVLESGVQLEVT